MLTVTVYSTPNCVQCRMTYVALDKAGIGYTVVDVATNDNAREYVIDDLGYSAAPVVVVDQDPDNHWSGFRREKIAALATHLGDDNSAASAATSPNR
jgi:glutaredoxin-like protein NrdH